MGYLGYFGGYTAAAGINTDYAQWLAANTHFRANGDDGDLYQLTDYGTVLTGYRPAGREGILVPSGLYDSLNGYVANALGAGGSGVAEWTVGMDEDTDGDLSDNGWTLTTTLSGTISKVGGSAAVLDSGTTNNATSNPKFSPTSLPTKSLSIVRVTLTDPAPSNGSCPFYLACGSGHYLRFEMSTSAEDGRSRFWDGSAQDGGGIITQGVGNDRTLYVFQDSSTADGSIWAYCIETGEYCVAQRSQVFQSGTTAMSFNCYNGGGTAVNQTTIGVYEWHWIEVT
jgi:hypothetical protein